MIIVTVHTNRNCPLGCYRFGLILHDLATYAIFQTTSKQSLSLINNPYEFCIHIDRHIQLLWVVYLITLTTSKGALTTSKSFQIPPNLL